MDNYTCKRCAVWRDRESVTWNTIREVEVHLVDNHPNRMIEYCTDLKSSSNYRDLQYAIAKALRNHNEDPV